MTKRINVGIAGFGMSGYVFHAPFIDADDRFCLKKVYERKSSRSKDLYPNVCVVRSFDGLLSDDIDIVVISTPNLVHFDMAKQALLAGKNVIVEKPLAVTSAEADELINIANEKGVILSVYQNRRWDGDFRTIKNIIESEMLGEIVYFESHFDRYAISKNSKEWKEINEKGVGALYDLGVHLIDQIYYLFGMPEEVYADLGTQRENADAMDNFQVILYYEGMKAVASSSMIVREKGPHFIVHGRKGSFIKYGMDVQEEALVEGKRPEGKHWGIEDKKMWGTINTEINGVHLNGTVETAKGFYGSFYENIYNVLNNKEEVAVKPEEARDVLKILEAAMESGEKGMRIKTN